MVYQHVVGPCPCGWLGVGNQLVSQLLDVAVQVKNVRGYAVEIIVRAKWCLISVVMREHNKWLLDNVR